MTEGLERMSVWAAERARGRHHSERISPRGSVLKRQPSACPACIAPHKHIKLKVLSVKPLKAQCSWGLQTLKAQCSSEDLLLEIKLGGYLHLLITIPPVHPKTL